MNNTLTIIKYMADLCQDERLHIKFCEFSEAAAQINYSAKKLGSAH